jgi:hypothetical protein
MAKTRKSRIPAGKSPETKPKKTIPDMVPLVIGDRKFVPAGKVRSFEQDMLMMSMIDELGIDDMPVEQLFNANVEKSARKFIVKAYRDGLLFKMLGTALVEEGKETEWSEEVAEEVGELFRECSDPEARTTLEKNMVYMLMDFFVSALASSMSSRSSLTAKLREAGIEVKSAKTGDPLISETSRTSSEGLRGIVQIANDRSLSGRSGKRS